MVGDHTTQENALEGIRSAATFLRKELRSRLSFRHTPFLKFDLDDSIKEAEHVLRLMDGIRISEPESSN